MTTWPAARVALARSLAWTVHTSGWLVLGAVGVRHQPLSLGGLLPTVLWLGLLAALLQARAGRPLAASQVRIAWLAAACVAAVAVAAGQPVGLGAAWALAAAASSWTVRLARGTLRSGWQQACVAALLGVAAGGAVGAPVMFDGPLASLLWPACGVVATGLCLTLGCAPARHACRHSRLEEWRALQGLDVRRWRTAGGSVGVPQGLAAAAMLPMMAGLPALLALCSADTPPPAVLALHLGAMVLPAAGLAALPRYAARLDAARLCAALLVAGGGALLALPMLQGLMAATQLHTAAWSLGWAAGLQAAPRRLAPPPATAPLAAAVGAAFTAVAGVSAGVAGLGLALAALGPLALWLVHAALAALALLWAAAQTWPRLRGHFALS